MKCPFCNNSMKRMRRPIHVWDYFKCTRHPSLVIVSTCGTATEINIFNNGYELSSIRGIFTLYKHKKRIKKFTSSDSNMFFYHKGLYYDFSEDMVFKMNHQDLKITPENFSRKIKTLLVFS